MPPELAIKARIAQIRGSGKVADPNTWIGYTHINKNGKKYTYYRKREGCENFQER